MMHAITDSEERFRTKSLPRLNVSSNGDSSPLRAGHVDPAHFHNTLITNLGIEQRYATIPTFRLETGFVLSNITVAYTCYGTLNERRDNAVVICHAMTGNADPKGSWWKSIFDTPDAVLNDPRLCVFCLNVLGSPYGSTCPLSYIDNDPARGTWGRKFPITTIRDDVRLHKLVLDNIGVRSVACVIGGSMGGMQALEWAYLGDEYVKSIIVMACGAQQSAWALGQNHLQRNLIIQSSDAPASLAAARVAAMMTYRSYASINRRFSRKDRLLPDANHDPTCQYAVQSYLNYQGAKFVSRFDANCYLAIMDKLDSHDLIRRPSNRNVCAATSSDENDDNTEHSSRRDSATASSPTDTAEAICIRQPALIIGITSDTLYPPIEQRNMAESIPKAELHILDSEEGHDAFLLEPIRINKLMADFMYQHLPVIS